MNTEKLLLACLVFMALLLKICSSRNNICGSSSCGKIENISYPFRLKSDPENCGVADYELTCENNVTLVHLQLRNFKVVAINYASLTIRVADPGIDIQDCSSLPSLPLSYMKLSDYFGRLSSSILPYYKIWNLDQGETIYFINCVDPVISIDYLDATPYGCSNSTVTGYKYAFLDFYMGGQQLMDGCRLLAMAPIQYSSRMEKSKSRMFSFKEIHRRMSLGFELSWFQFYCPNCTSSECRLDLMTNQYACFPTGISFLLYFLLLS
ncbi:hypothetical protein M5689_024291 [Euphorbia peplus]|nr:hypothetical protein M5689_024291 [Euphorbia peplus]